MNNTEVFSSEVSVETWSAKEDLFPQEEYIFGEYFDGGRMLDLGCGAGRTTKHLVDKGLDVVGVDISRELVEKARELHPDTDFVVADACSLPFEDDSFDFVLFSFNGLDYLFPEGDRVEAIREIKRVLKPGGLFVFSTHNQPYLLPKSVKGYWSILKRVARNLVRGSLFSSYFVDRVSYGELLTHVTSVGKQRKELRDNGFGLLEVRGVHGGFLKRFEGWLYYVSEAVGVLRE